MMHLHSHLIHLLIRSLPVLMLLCFGIKSGFAAAIVPPVGLTGWWTGDSNTVDLVNGNNATLLNGAGYASGTVSNAFSFDGVNDTAQAGDSAAWAFGTNEFTIELWANFAANTGQRALVASDTGGGAQNKWIFWLNNGVLQFHINGTPGTAFIGTAAFAPNLSQWYHLAVTRKSTNYVFYIDGSAVSTNADSRIVPDANAPLTFGSAEGALFFGGQLDEISIYNRALAGSEIADIVTAGADGKVKALYDSANTVWASPVSGDWNTATNWLPNRVPRPADTVWITNTGTFTVSISNAASANNLIMGLADTNATGIRTLNLAAGSLTVTNATIETNGAVNFSGGTLTVRGLATAKGDFTWTAGTITGGGELQAGSASGITTISGAGAKTLSGATLGNYSSAGSWSGANWTVNAGATFYNSGNLTMTNDQTFAFSSGAAVGFDNYGTVTKNGGSGQFLLSSVRFRNNGTMNINSGSLALTAITATNTGSINLGATSQLLFNSGTLQLGGSVNAPTADSLRFIGGTASITSTGIASPSIWIAGATVLQQAAISVPTVNQSSGTFQLSLACVLGNYNLTNGDLRGGTLTVTNFTWTDGTLYALTNGDKLIIPTNGVFNLLGAGEKSLFYFAPATLGYGVDNYGTWNWSGACILRGFGSTVNNYGTVTLTAPTLTYYSYYSLAYPAPRWNNYGTFTKSTGAGTFSFNGAIVNNTGTLNVQAGTCTFESSTKFTNSAVINLSASALLLNDGSSESTWGANSVITAPTANSIRIPSGSVYLQTVNVTTPALWINGGTLYQQAPNVVNTINQSAGTWWLSLTTGVNTYNLTNGALRGGTLTVTNFAWTDGALYANTNGDKLIIPAGGVFNLLGAGEKSLFYFAPATLGYGVDNYGTWNWSGSCILRGFGSTVNNYGTVNMTATGTAYYSYYSVSYPTPTWNNYGTFTKSGGAGVFYFNGIYLNNSASINASAGTLSVNGSTFANSGAMGATGTLLQFYGATGTNTGSINLGSGTPVTVDGGSVITFAPTASLSAPTLNSVQLISGSLTLASTNFNTPSIWINGGTLYQRTNIVVATINESGGTLQLDTPGFLGQLNQTNGNVQGRTLTVTNWNWFAGNHYRGTPAGDTNNDRTIIPAGGVMNFLGTDGGRVLSYYTSGPGRAVDNFGTVNWSGSAVLSSYGAFNNYGSVTVSAVGAPQYYSVAPSVPSAWNNYGTFTRLAGTLFYFQGGLVNNAGLMDLQQGTVSIYNATFTNTTGLLNVGSGAVFQSENNGVVVLGAASQLMATTPDSVRFGGASATIETTNILSPTLWLQAGTLYQRTNIAVAAINESGGALQLDVPATLNRLNQTNGDVQGRTLTVTNWNWFAGNHYRGTTTANTNDDRTIIPAGGTMNLLGTATRYLSYLVNPAPGRTLDNFGTVNWSGDAIFGGYGTVNNYGSVNVSGAGTAQYYSPNSTAIWNNYGTFTRSVGTLFYFQTAFVNNAGTMNLQSGTVSLYTSTFTNSTGLVSLGGSGILQSEANSSVVLGAASQLIAPGTNSVRLAGASATIETTNILSPALWLQAGTLYQRTNIAVAAINESGGALQLDVPAALGQLNQTNGDVQGRTLTVTNWNWFAGNHYRGTTTANTNDDRTIIPVGGTMNLLGTATRYLSYLVNPAPGRTLDNFGTVNWSGDAIFGGYGTVNNYGSVNVSGAGTAQYYSPNSTAIWNNFGTFTRSVGTLLYFQASFLNNAGTLNLQSGTLSLLNATFTNSTGGNVLVQPGAILANDGSTSSYEPGSSVACADTNAFRVNSGTVNLRTTAISAPSLWINGGTLNQNTNNVVPVINETAGTWKLNVPVSVNTYNLTSGELRGANLVVDTFNWLGGNLNADGPNSNLVTVASALNIVGAAAKSMSYYTAPGRTVINNGNAIWGGGSVTFSGQSSFVNNGNWTVTNDVALGWTLTGSAAPLFQNNGTFTKSGGAGILTLGSTTFTNNGTVAINSGGITVGGPFVQTAGSAFLGTNFNANSTVSILAGSLSGKGNIGGAFFNNGVVNPGASPGFINGVNFTNTAAAIYNVEIGGNTGAGTNYDQLRFTGPVTLDGTLNVNLHNNYALLLSNRFTVLTTSARTGTFATVIPPPGATLNTIYSSTNVVLEVIGLTNAPLQILTNPASQTVWTPDPASFSATVSGVTPLSFQWQFNGSNIAGATNITYAIPAVAVTNDGLYTLLITDGTGGTTNTSATLTVIPFANTIYWTNVLGGNWSVPANWVPNRIPNGTNNVVIVSNGTYTVTMDVPAALSNLTVGAPGAIGTPTVHLVNGQSLTVNGNTSWETNSVLALNGLLQMRGGSNSVRGHIDWQLGTLSGAGRTVIATNASLTFVGSLNQKFIVTNILENYGTFNYGNDSFGNAQGLRFSGGAQLTNYPSGVISIGTAAYDYSGAQTPRSYFVNYGTINANSSVVFSPTYLSIDFINYGTLQDNGYVYISRGTNYGTFSWGNTLCEVSVFGDETTGEYFSFENGTTFVGAYPSLAVGGYAQWNSTSVHPGRVTVFSGSGGYSFASPEFRILKNYTQSGQTYVYKGRWTQANPTLTADLNEMTDGLVNNFHSFVITNAGTLNMNTLSHGVRNLANSGSIVVRSNLSLAGSSYTYGGGTLTIAASAGATFSGGTVEAQTVRNFGTNSVTGGMAFIGGTFYRNYAGAQTYFGGGSFGTGPAGVLNEGLLNGFGGISALNVTNRATVLADDYLSRNLGLANYVQESGLTALNPGNVSGNLNILGGLITGTGTVTGNLRNAANLLPGQPFGLLSVTGNYTNAAGGTYFLPINGAVAITNFPQTRVTGTSVLAGTLSVNFTNGFNPAPGNLFTALVFTARSGVFDTIVNDTYGLEAFYTATTLVLRAENILPNVTITVVGGATQLVCQPFKFSAAATDPDGTVTNLILRLDGSTVASSAGSSVKSQGESDSPRQVSLVAQATDDRGGVRTVTQAVGVINYSLTNVLFLGGVRTNDFKLCLVGEPGRDYEVFASTNLTTTNWVDIGTMTMSNGTWRYLDPLTITNRPLRFYRTKQLP